MRKGRRSEAEPMPSPREGIRLNHLRVLPKLLQLSCGTSSTQTPRGQQHQDFE